MMTGCGGLIIIPIPLLKYTFQGLGQSAVGGGGRYNGLVEQCGGPDLPVLVLPWPGTLVAGGEKRRMLLPPPEIDVFVAVMDSAYEAQGMKILQALRGAGIKAEKDYNQRKARAQMKFADKIGARLVLFLGEEEVQKGFVTLRNMRSKEQFQVAENDLLRAVSRTLLID